MPTYDYVCDACGESFEIFHSIVEPPRTECPSCGQNKLRRLIGTGGALIFKGAGFYATDYRRAGKKDSQSESKAVSTESTGSKAASSGAT